MEKNKKEVQDKINQWVLNIQSNNITVGNCILFSEYCNNYINTYKYGFVKDSTYVVLYDVINSVIRDSDIDIPLYKLDDIIVQKFLNSKCYYSVSRIRQIYNMIYSVLRYAYRRKDIAVDIAGLLIVPKSKQIFKERNIYSDEDVYIFQSILHDTFFNARLQAYAVSYIIILNTGLRMGEFLALTWNDIDFDKRVLYVRTSVVRSRRMNDIGCDYVIGSTKSSNSIRKIPLNDLAISCLHYLHDEYLFTTYVLEYDGSFVKPQTYNYRFRSVCRELALPYYGVHALRHTFASRLIRRGVPPKVVSELLGHASVSFTLDRYVHVYDDDVMDAVGLLLNDDAFITPDE